jgi:hypothetical protein
MAADQQMQRRRFPKIVHHMTKSRQVETVTKSHIFDGGSSVQFILAAVSLTFIFAAPSTQGRIHEEYEACVARYGQPIEKSDGALAKPQKVDRLVHFKKGAYTVTIGFIEDRAVSLVFAHTDGSPLRPVTVIDLLRENSEDSGFMGVRRGPTVAGQKFERSDHRAAALWARIEGKLLIWDTAYQRGESKARKREERASGF